MDPLFSRLCVDVVEAMGPCGELTTQVAGLSTGDGTILPIGIWETRCKIPQR